MLLTKSKFRMILTLEGREILGLLFIKTCEIIVVVAVLVILKGIGWLGGWYK